MLTPEGQTRKQQLELSIDGWVDSAAQVIECLHECNIHNDHKEEGYLDFADWAIPLFQARAQRIGIGFSRPTIYRYLEQARVSTSLGLPPGELSHPVAKVLETVPQGEREIVYKVAEAVHAASPDVIPMNATLMKASRDTVEDMKQTGAVNFDGESYPVTPATVLAATADFYREGVIKQLERMKGDSAPLLKGEFDSLEDAIKALQNMKHQGKVYLSVYRK